MTLIKLVNGDLLDAKENLICHQVNTNGRMGSGVAKQIKKKWFEVFEAYECLCEAVPNHESIMGHAHVVRINENQSVVNLFGQKNYGRDGKRYTDYEALYTALEEVARIARHKNLSVAFPYKMSSDLGGGDWNIVYAMIESVFKNHTQPVVIYNLGGQWEHSFNVTPPESQIQKELVLN